MLMYDDVCYCVRMVALRLIVAVAVVALMNTMLMNVAYANAGDGDADANADYDGVDDADCGGGDDADDVLRHISDHRCCARNRLSMGTGHKQQTTDQHHPTNPCGRDFNLCQTAATKPPEGPPRPARDTTLELILGQGL